MEGRIDNRADLGAEIALTGLSSNVRAHRFRQMQELMREESYDALAFAGSDWFEWISNAPVAGATFERPFLLVVTGSGSSFALLSELDRNAMIARARRGELWLDSAAYYAESHDPARHGVIASQWREMVVEALRAAGLERKRIGSDTLPDWLAQAAALLDTDARKVGAKLRRLRLVKHADEIATMRQCAQLSDWAVSAYREELAPGRPLAEIDFTVSARLAAEAARRVPGENFLIVRLQTLSGAAAACPGGDGASAGRTLQGNAPASTTIATRLNGLAMELARPWLVGSLDASSNAMFDCAFSAQRAAMEQLIAGRPVSAIHMAAQSVFDGAGFGNHLRLRAGHGIGVMQHDFPVDMPFESRALLENEVYAVEPGLFIADVGAFKFADTLAVGAAGPVHLTTPSKGRVDQAVG
jgi:Xaa-Pro aminopeptidase